MTDVNIVRRPSSGPGRITFTPPQAASHPVRLHMIGWQREYGHLKHIDWNNASRSGEARRNVPWLIIQASLDGPGGCFSDPSGTEEDLPPGRVFVAPVPSHTRYWLPKDR
ncbi:MAG: hypothetical protein ACYTGH_19495, partial [Planctomycetota bacterium]